MKGGVVPGGKLAQLHLTDRGDLGDGIADVDMRLERRP